MPVTESQRRAGQAGVGAGGAGRTEAGAGEGHRDISGVLDRLIMLTVESPCMYNIGQNLSNCILQTRSFLMLIFQKINIEQLKKKRLLAFRTG